VSTKHTREASEAPKPGRPEVLNEDLARKIARFIELFPDMEVDVTWANAVAQIKQKFGVQLGRRVLSQKEWHGRKLIGEAFETAKKVQGQLRAGGKRLPHSTTSRQNLQIRVQTLTTQLKEAKDKIEELRVMQYDHLDVLRITRFDLRKEVDKLERS
jgi:hypothetical protein